MNEEILENKIGFQLNFLKYSDKPIDETLRDLKLIALEYAKQFKNKDEDFTEKEKHENYRKQIWCDVYVAYVSSANSTNREGAKKWADIALQRFDECFEFNKNS